MKIFFISIKVDLKNQNTGQVLTVDKQVCTDSAITSLNLYIDADSQRDNVLVNQDFSLDIGFITLSNTDGMLNAELIIDINGTSQQVQHHGGNFTIGHSFLDTGIYNITVHASNLVSDISKTISVFVTESPFTESKVETQNYYNGSFYYDQDNFTQASFDIIPQLQTVNYNIQVCKDDPCCDIHTLTAIETSSSITRKTQFSVIPTVSDIALTWNIDKEIEIGREVAITPITNQCNVEIELDYVLVNQIDNTTSIINGDFLNTSLHAPGTYRIRTTALTALSPAKHYFSEVFDLFELTVFFNEQTLAYIENIPIVVNLTSPTPENIHVDWCLEITQSSSIIFCQNGEQSTSLNFEHSGLAFGRYYLTFRARSIYTSNEISDTKIIKIYKNLENGIADSSIQISTSALDIFVNETFTINYVVTNVNYAEDLEVMASDEYEEFHSTDISDSFDFSFGEEGFYEVEFRIENAASVSATNFAVNVYPKWIEN